MDQRLIEEAARIAGMPQPKGEKKTITRERIVVLANYLVQLHQTFLENGMHQTADLLNEVILGAGMETGLILTGRHSTKLVEDDEVSEEDRTPGTLSIDAYIHCAKCLEEIPIGLSPRDYAMLEVGFTKYGLQIWCKRHNANVMHIDFEGKKHPANLRANLHAEEEDDVD